MKTNPAAGLTASRPRPVYSMMPTASAAAAAATAFGHTSPQCGQERSTCRHFISIHAFTRSRFVIHIALYMSLSTCRQCGLGIRVLESKGLKVKCRQNRDYGMCKDSRVSADN